MTFDVTWRGNDHGTYSSPLTVTLPLREAVEFPVTVTPAGHGVHTAHLTLHHDDVAGYAHRMHAAIVAPEPLNAANEFTAKNEVEVPRPGMKSLFFDVPEGVTALKIDVSWEDRPVTLGVFRPDTRGQRGEMVRSGGSGITQVVHSPVAGTWEVRLGDIADTRTFDWEQAKKAEPVPPTKATLTVSALAADVEVVTDETVVDNGVGEHQVWIANRMAAFEGGAVTTAAGSARRGYHRMGARDQDVYEVEVLPGSTALMVRVGAVETGGQGGGADGVDLDVYVFDCTGDECRAARVDGDPEGDEVVIVHDPAPGMWKVVVDAASVPGEEATYSYLDVVFNAAYGTVAVIDMPQERASGARWTTTAHGWAAMAAHARGREPYLGVVVEGRAGGGGYWVGVGEVR